MSILQGMVVLSIIFIGALVNVFVPVDYVYLFGFLIGTITQLAVVLLHKKGRK